MALELGGHRALAALAEGADQRRETLGAAAEGEAAGLLRHDGPGPGDLLGGPGRAFREDAAQALDVHEAHPGDLGGGRVHVPRHRQVEEEERSCATRHRPPHGLGVQDDPGRAGRRDHEIGALDGRWKGREVAVLRARPLGECSGPLRRAVQHPDGLDPTPPQVADGEARHPPGADDDRGAPLEPPEGLGGELGAGVDEGVGGRADPRFGPHAPPGPEGGLEQPGEGPVHGALGLGRAERVADLGQDLGLAEDHGVEPRGHLQEVLDGLVLVVGDEGRSDLAGLHAPGLAEQALQGLEARVVGGHRGVDLDPVAGREHDPAVDGGIVEDPAVRLGQVVVAEREPLEQLHARGAVGDAEGEDGHGRVAHGSARRRFRLGR
ncbi:hypothetical protein HRbin12_01546 [bacterium HR12]|nr:hypothetical protein HRbin12_01546 [bacterium HR12]